MVSVMQLLFSAVRTFVQVAFLASFVFGIALVQPLDLCFSGASFFACLRILCSLLSHESPLSANNASYCCKLYLTFSFRQHKSWLNPADF